MSKPTAGTTQELMVDFITSLDGYGSAEGWPGWWGLEGPEYLGWLESGGSDFTALMCQGSPDFPGCDHENSPPVIAGRSALMASRWARMR
jgi:hypothetical protein